MHIYYRGGGAVPGTPVQCYKMQHSKMHCRDVQCSEVFSVKPHSIAQNCEVQCSRKHCAGQLDPDAVLSHGLESRGQPRMNTQAGSQAALPSEADEVNTHMGHSSSIRERGEEQIDWEISSYTCSSLMKEVIKI